MLKFLTFLLVAAGIGVGVTAAVAATGAIAMLAIGALHSVFDAVPPLSFGQSTLAFFAAFILVRMLKGGSVVVHKTPSR